MDKKKKTILTVIIAGVLLVSIVGTYAFFTSTANNDNKLTGVIKTGTMSLIFSDGNTNINESLMFGESVTKKFIIENNGSLEASLSLDWKDLINTYLNGSLSYNLSYSTEENGTYSEIIPETNMPVSSEKLTQTLASELSVPANDTYYYNLTITLNNTDFDQSDDIDAVFNTSFDVSTPVRYRYYKLIVDPNRGVWNEFTAPQEYLLKNEETKDITGTPTRTGYDFLGWKLSGISSTLVDNTFTMGIGDTTLTAKWSLTPYTLTIDANGGTYEGDTTRDITYLNSVDINTPTREGHTFTGWEITGGRIESGKFILTEAKNASIKATWDANTYKYIINHNKENIGGVGSTFVEADTGTASYGTKVGHELKTYRGFTAPAKRELTIKVENKQETGEDIYPPEVNKLDYIYKRDKHNLIINPNGGTYNGSTTNTTIPLYYEETIELPTSSGVQDTLNALGVTTKTGRPNFATVATTDETADGLYSMEDDYGTSYYYRGAVENNYVKFGKWAAGAKMGSTDMSGKDMWWRIIRVNGDGSLRMIYDGTQGYANANNGNGNGGADRFIATGIPWNTTNYNDAKYVGYMYGGANGTASTSKSGAQTNQTSTNIKTVIDSWYETNLKSTYGQYIADAIYCNDRSVPPNGTTWWTSQAVNDKLGFAQNVTPYGGFSRFLTTAGGWNTTNPSPKFVCPQKNDAFTVSDTTKGNGSLVNPVGLVTADEAVTAGAVPGTTSKYHYLYKNSSYWYWSLSPRDMGSSGYAGVFIVNYDGYLYGYRVNSSGAVAPVISLKAEYTKTMTGSGSATDPYEIPEAVTVLESPTKEGYNFANWTKTSGNGLLDSATFKMDTEDTTIEANYTPKEYQVRFIANGGTVDTLSKKVTYSAKYGVLPIPTYTTVTGYEFLGWYTEREGGVEVTADTDFTIASDQTLYAHWNPSTFSVSEAVTAILNKQTPKGVKTSTPNFEAAATTNEGVFSMADDYGTSYYYRGAVTNNYVKFANKYWRIIRVNGDGSLRMIYDGTVPHKNGEGNETFEITGVNGSTLSADRFINNGAKTAFNPSYNDNAYVGWMYGQTGQSGEGAYDRTHANTNNSPIKDLVNTWYDQNLASYDQYIADAVYCADRSVPGAGITGWTGDTGLGYGGQATAYGATARTAAWNSTTQPQFKCPNKKDAFTVSDSAHGNAIGTAKSRKIGLITADEIVAAGSGKYNTINRNYYLYKSSNYLYWSLSPLDMYDYGGAIMFLVGADGCLYSVVVTSSGSAVAPVISISANYAKTMTGTGTALDPYVIPGVA